MNNEKLTVVIQLYAKYLMDIFDDRKEGIRLLYMARALENNNQQKKTIKLGMQGDLNIDGQQDGQIFISLDEDKLG